MPPPKDSQKLLEYKNKQRKIAIERNFGKWMVGKKLSEDHKNNIRNGVKNNLPSTAFKKGRIVSQKERDAIGERNKRLGIKPPSALGIKRSEEFKKGISNRFKGKKLPIYHRKKLSEAKIGEKNNNWKGGTTPYTAKLRGGRESRIWRESVCGRDNNKCKINNCDCSGRLIAHHILPWRDFPELRYNINNGITLCQFHHPRKREDEKRLIPFFQSMVEVK